MKKLLVLLFLGCLVILQAQQLFVKEKVSSLSTHELTNIRKITFSDGTMQLNSFQGVSTPYSLNSVRYVNFWFRPAPTQPTELIENKELKGNIVLYPNPVCNQLFFKFKGVSATSCLVTIVGLEGRTLYSSQTLINEDANSIDVSSFAAGVYIFHLNDGQRIFSSKFIKIK